MKQLFFVFSLLLIGTAGIAQQGVAPVQAIRYQTKKFDAAIFPANSKESLGGVRFTPTKADIDQAESGLRKKLSGLNVDLANQYETPVVDKELDNYKRQYFGYRDKAGNRIVLINCFWGTHEHFKEWLSEQIDVRKGGSYYWNVKYNLDTGELFDLKVNGRG